MTLMAMSANGSILYVGYDPNYALLRRRRLSGICRFAKAHGWDVATLSPEEATPEAVRDAIARVHAVGCIVECWKAHYDLSSCRVGSVPVIFFNPPERRAWRGVAKVVCDEAAVARAAFRELASGLPSDYAVIAEGPTRGSPWARKRIAAFRDCCRTDGKPCRVFPERNGEDESARLERLQRWVAALPPHCAIFAVNDLAAVEVAKALAATGRSLPRSATLVGVDAAEIPADGLPASTISSVKLDFELSGYLAAKMIARMLAAKNAKTTKENSAFSASFAAEKTVFGPLFVERRQSTRGRGRREPWVMEAVDMIRREACDGLAAEALARRFPVSRNLFERRFREAMGHSVLDEIIHVRMQRVFDLLARPDFPIGTIADFSGFGCGYGLRKLFSARTGMSLREWRKTRR